MSAEPTAERARSCYLSPHQLKRLDLACIAIREAFPNYGPVLVGSVGERTDFRDVDVRVILRDKDFDHIFGKGTADSHGEAHSDPRWSLLCSALSEWLSDLSGLPVDFQIQRMTEANATYSSGARNPLGVRWAQR